MTEQSKRIHMLANEKIPTLILKLSAPAIMGMLVNAIYNFADAVFVGRLGTDYLSAATIALPYLLIITAVGLTFGIGGGAYASRLLGEKDFKQANKTASTTIFLGAFFGLLFTLSTFPFTKGISIFLGAEENTVLVDLTSSYIKIISLGAVFTCINMAINNLLRAEGSAFHSMIGMASGAIINIVLDPIFIFVFDMGIVGAAWATVISQICSTIILSRYFFNQKSVLKISFKYICISKKILREILKIGIPTFIRQILASISLTLINKIAGGYGSYAISGLGGANRIVVLGTYVLFGLSQGYQPIAGFSYGAKNFTRLRQSYRVTILYSTAFSVVFTLALLIFPTQLMSLFSKEADVIAVGSKYLRILCIVLPFLGFAITSNTYFQAIGRAWQSALLSLSRQGIFLIPAIIILPKLYGLNGLLFTQVTADIFTLILTTALMIPQLLMLRKNCITEKIGEKHE